MLGTFTLSSGYYDAYYKKASQVRGLIKRDFEAAFQECDVIGMTHPIVKHSILIAYWHMFTTGEVYRELGGDYYQRRDPERQTRRLVAQLEQLGHHVILEAAAA